MLAFALSHFKLFLLSKNNKMLSAKPLTWEFMCLGNHNAYYNVGLCWLASLFGCTCTRSLTSLCVDVERPCPSNSSFLCCHTENKIRTSYVFFPPRSEISECWVLAQNATITHTTEITLLIGLKGLCMFSSSQSSSRICLPSRSAISRSSLSLQKQLGVIPSVDSREGCLTIPSSSPLFPDQSYSLCPLLFVPLFLSLLLGCVLWHTLCNDLVVYIYCVEKPL